MRFFIDQIACIQIFERDCDLYMILKIQPCVLNGRLDLKKFLNRINIAGYIQITANYYEAVVNKCLIAKLPFTCLFVIFAANKTCTLCD